MIFSFKIDKQNIAVKWSTNLPIHQPHKSQKKQNKCCKSGDTWRTDVSSKAFALKLLHPPEEAIQQKKTFNVNLVSCIITARVTFSEEDFE